MSMIRKIILVAAAVLVWISPLEAAYQCPKGIGFMKDSAEVMKVIKESEKAFKELENKCDSLYQQIHREENAEMLKIYNREGKYANLKKKKDQEAAIIDLQLETQKKSKEITASCGGYINGKTAKDYYSDCARSATLQLNWLNDPKTKNAFKDPSTADIPKDTPEPDPEAALSPQQSPTPDVPESPNQDTPGGETPKNPLPESPAGTNPTQNEGAVNGCSSDLGLFSGLIQTGNKIFKGLRDLIYTVAGFGIMAVAVGGFFGNLNWKWLGAIVISLVVIATTGELIDALTGCENYTKDMITDTLK